MGLLGSGQPLLCLSGGRPAHHITGASHPSTIHRLFFSRLGETCNVPWGLNGVVGAKKKKAKRVEAKNDDDEAEATTHGLRDDNGQMMGI